LLSQTIVTNLQSEAADKQSQMCKMPVTKIQRQTQTCNTNLQLF